MTKNLEQYRLAARLRRRPPSCGEDGVIRVSLTPPAGSQEVFMESRMRSYGLIPAATVIYPLRANGRRYSPSEFSSAEQMLQKLRNGEDLRADKVTQIRQALAADSYENAQKMEEAVERLLNDLAVRPADTEDDG